jgi:hypothetical protein
MKKKLLLVCMAVGLTGIFAGCGTEVSTGGSEEITVNVSDMANELQSEITYEDTLSQLDGDMALTYYGIDKEDVADSVVIVSTGATAEEIAVFEAVDKDAAADIKTACDNRKEKQTTSYSDYKPAEVSRLDNAIIKSEGNYVVYCVTDDTSKANEIIYKYFK